ncbi:unnamed protein product [Trichobilharzia szidati]|nr:unnamed protein product [Trichobilharzia szidati]
MHIDEAIFGNLSFTCCVSTGLVEKLSTSLAAGNVLSTALLSRHFRMSAAISPL